MYPVGRIIDSCKKCHHLHDLSADKVTRVSRAGPGSPPWTRSFAQIATAGTA